MNKKLSDIVNFYDGDSPNAFLFALFLTCGWKLKGSEEEPVITTLIVPSASSSLCQSGLILIICAYRSTHILRLIQTIIALPSSTSLRDSKCFTISLAINSNRCSFPTIASNLPHLDIKFCLSDSSSFSVSSSNSASTASSAPLVELLSLAPAQAKTNAVAARWPSTATFCGW